MPGFGPLKPPPTISTPNLNSVVGQGGTLAASSVISLTDNVAAALSIREAANDYLVFRTTNAGEQVRVTQTLVATGALQVAGTTTLTGGLDLNQMATAVSASIAASRTYVGATAGGITLTLPPVASVNDGHIIIIKDEAFTADVSNIIIDGNASETIDLALTYTMNIRGQSITLIKRNAQWWVI